jgi:hypothetical protein
LRADQACERRYITLVETVVRKQKEADFRWQNVGLLKEAAQGR